MKALHIPADESKPFEIVEVPKKDSLERLQQLVGGYIQSCPVPTNEISVYCNEEGKIMGLPLNTRASFLWAQLWGEPLDDFLVGDVLILGGVDKEGYETPVPQPVVDAMEQLKGKSHARRDR